MAKTELTKELEKKIWQETHKKGLFGCFEVTIGFGGDERVDYLTFDTKGIWRCYEIKVSKSDFFSKAKKTFSGHYNYFVMTKELYEKVKEEIPSHIGVYCGRNLIKRPQKQQLEVDEQILKDSMIRSLSRENEKFIKTSDTTYLNNLKNRMTRSEEKARANHNKYLKMYHAIREICNEYNLNFREVKQFIREHI